jgi:hypothetical protein
VYWFSNYLYHIHHTIWVSSSLAEIKAGDIRDFFIVPLFFLVYINDITNETEANINLFAGDISFYLLFHTPDYAVAVSESDIDTFAKWTDTWLIQCNLLKSEQSICTILHFPY